MTEDAANSTPIAVDDGLILGLDGKPLLTHAWAQHAAKEYGYLPRDDEWSKTNIIHQLQLPEVMEKGLASARAAPYRPLGTPDLRRDRTHLPKKYKFYKPPPQYLITSKPSVSSESIASSFKQQIVIPLTLKGSYWNGERWCGSKFTAVCARSASGSYALHQEILKSQDRLFRVRNGQYFLTGIRSTNEPINKFKKKKKMENNKTEGRPYIPPLRLSILSGYSTTKQLEANAGILDRYKSARSTRSIPKTPTTTTSRTGTQYAQETYSWPIERDKLVAKILMEGFITERSFNDMPSKACEDSSLKQLSIILNTQTNSNSLQTRLNLHLLQELKSLNIVRYYTYSHRYSTLDGSQSARNAEWGPASPRKAETFRKALEKHRWYEELIDMSYSNHQEPSDQELFILNNIRQIVESGATFGAKEYFCLLKSCIQNGIPINSEQTGRALVHMQKSLLICDESLFNGFAVPTSLVPVWLPLTKLMLKQIRRYQIRLFSLKIMEPFHIRQSITSCSPVKVKEAYVLPPIEDDFVH